MKVDGSLKSLLQGVSQQPPRDRLPGQCTEQINMSADPVSGLGRRAPTDLVGPLMTSASSRAWWNFETVDGNKFIAGFRDNTVQVWDYAGVAKTVTVTPGAATYLGSSGDLSFATLENQVVVVNKSKTVKMVAGGKPFANKGTGSSPMGIIQVLGGQYGREYRVSMDGVTIAMYKPPDGSAAPMVDFVRTTHIAQRLFEAMTDPTPAETPNIDGDGSHLSTTSLLNGSGWTVTRWEDLILIERNSSTSFTLSASDDAGNTNLKVCTDQVPDVADVPRMAPSGYLLRVATETDPEEDLFLEFMREDGLDSVGTGFGQVGFWQETVSSDVDYLVDKTTMPHVLEYDPIVGDFELRVGNWQDRRVGTDVSNPLPSFIDTKIEAVTTFQSRLVFLAGAYVSMSRTNRYEDFWMSSASSLVDTDPIDMSSTNVEATVMKEAVPHNKDLVIFTKKGQFVIFGRTALTPANATLVLTTSFEAELRAKPVPAGRNVFFATNYGRYTGVREFFSDGNNDVNDTRPITQHVKQYIVGKVKHMAASSNYDMMVLNTDVNSGTLYLYQYIWTDTDKIQSAWSKWYFPDRVEYFFFDEEILYIVMSYLYEGTRVYYMSGMSMDVLPVAGMQYPDYKDNRIVVTGVTDTITLPHGRLFHHDTVVHQGEGCPNVGMLCKVLTKEWNGSAYVLTLKSNMNGGTVSVGVPNLASYEPTMPLVKDQDNVAIATAKLTIKHFIISLQQTGYISGQLLSKYGDGEIVNFEGRIVGSPDNLIGQPALSDEQFIMPFREDSTKASLRLFTDRNMPMTLLDIEWLAQYTKKGRRISNGGQS